MYFIQTSFSHFIIIFAGAVADRLIGGDDHREGIVEIAYNGRWGMMCDSDLSITDAQSICRELGFGIDKAEVIPAASSRLTDSCFCVFNVTSLRSVLHNI